MWQSLLLTIIGIAGYLATAYAFMRLMGKKSLDGWELFWIGFGYLILVGEFWR